MIGVAVELGAAGNAGASRVRPLVNVPAALGNEVSQPCALFMCVTDPKPFTNWENTLGALPATYCMVYHCSPMDLIPDNGFDANLFPFNPDWAYFAETGQVPDADQLCQRFTNGVGSPPCTTQPVTYDAPAVDTFAYFLCPAGRSPYFSFHGHVNYEPATYEGILSWESHSDPGSDDDYSLNLYTDGGDGATTGDLPGTVHIEFDSTETINNFDNSPWWKKFHSAVDNSDAHARSVINGDLAEVTGLIGLDTAHTPGAESHPVYAIAIETNRKAALAGGTDTWALFARNWGNEGYCSQRTHTLPRGPLTIRIPWLNGATGAVFRPATQVQITNTSDLWDNITPNGTLAIRVDPGVGVFLTFDLSAAPSRQPLYWGTIGLKWTFGPLQAFSGTSVPPQPTPPSKLPAASGSANPEATDVEALAARLWSKLKAPMRRKALATLPQPKLKTAAARVKLQVAGPPTAPLRGFGAFVAPAVDGPIIALGRAESRAICAAYGDHVPGHPAMCRTIARR